MSSLALFVLVLAHASALVHPPALASPGLLKLNTESVEFANANRARIIASINADPSSSWHAAMPVRFQNQSYSAFLRDGAGVLGGDPRENLAGLPVKTYKDISKFTGILDIPANFSSVQQWGGVCPILKEVSLLPLVVACFFFFS
jgi:hypothetical protein